MLGFNIFKKTSKQSKVVLGMVLLNELHPVNFDEIAAILKDQYSLDLKEDTINSEKDIAAFQHNNIQIAILVVDLPIPDVELAHSSKIAYLWPEAQTCAEQHVAHVIISASSSTESKLNIFKTFTRVASAVQESTHAAGIYIGNQSLMLSSPFYIEHARAMTEEDLPLFIWIYFGFREIDGKRNGYTSGLREFGFDEVEIINSRRSFEDLREMLFNISHFILLSNTRLKDGQTIGLSPEEKLLVRKSKGVLVEGSTFKVEY